MRVVILTSRPYGIAADCFAELLQSDRIEIVAVVQAAGANPATSVRRRWRRIRKVARIGPLGALNGIRMRSWYAESATRSVEELCREAGVLFQRTPFVGSAETERVFRAAAPDLGLSLGNSYIPRRIFAIPGRGMVNLHTERLPEYQNAQSVIWPIYNGETTSGLTLHQIDEGIDTGRILYKEELQILFGPTLEQTVRDTLAVIRSRAPAAVRRLCEEHSEIAARAEPQEVGRSYTTPSLRQFLRMLQNNRRLYRAGGGQTEIDTPISS